MYFCVELIFLLNELFVFSVKPGPLKCVVEKDAQALVNLLPDSTVENFILEVCI